MKLDKQKFEIAKARKCLRTIDIAKKSGVSIPVLMKIGVENYEMKPITVGKIAKALGVDVTELLED
ncbi:hypothetical protein [Fusobacterium gonidiaformans]|uniref:hypothetical protein n=1 Tax=Fusobacterium gonidiaformans TaxID=849 RepID=UPI0023F31DC6|nr:hypothetical protein [Fusobacterium gonidiaformans]